MKLTTFALLATSLFAQDKPAPKLAEADKVAVLKATVALLQAQQALERAAAEYQKLTAAAMEKAGAKGCQLTADAEIVCPDSKK